jgi:5-methylcytosine-specific restriction enzyme A
MRSRCTDEQQGGCHHSRCRYPEGRNEPLCLGVVCGVHDSAFPRSCIAVREMVLIKERLRNRPGSKVSLSKREGFPIRQASRQLPHRGAAMALMKRCLGCGDLAHASRCPDCRLKRSAPSGSQRGYPAWWTRLSKQARNLQAWCSSCHSPGTEANPLIVDHTPEAWALVQAGKRLALNHFRSGLLSVLCLRCNVAQGAARGDNATCTHDETSDALQSNAKRSLQ